MVETAPRQWEAKIVVQQRETTGTRIQVGVIAAVWALALFVIWFFEG